jgi:hypothetical protein
MDDSEDMIQMSKTWHNVIQCLKFSSVPAFGSFKVAVSQGKYFTSNVPILLFSGLRLREFSAVKHLSDGNPESEHMVPTGNDTEAVTSLITTCKCSQIQPSP